MTIEDQLIVYFKNTHSVDVDASTQLIENGLIDSMGVMELLTFIADSYAVEFEIDDMTEENLSSIDAISGLIKAKQGAH